MMYRSAKFVRTLAPILIVGQCAAQEQRFEAASVKVTSGGRYAAMTGGPGASDPGRVRFVRVSLAALLAAAYGVQLDQVSGPAWTRDPLGSDRYDVVATLAPGTTKEQFRAMLQRLLAERFELVVHHETRGVPGYALVVAMRAASRRSSRRGRRIRLPRGRAPQRVPLRLRRPRGRCGAQCGRLSRRRNRMLGTFCLLPLCVAALHSFAMRSRYA